jgi:hypothetical protein
MVSHNLPFSVTVVHEDSSLVLALAGELNTATRPVLEMPSVSCSSASSALSLSTLPLCTSST